ncbi:hypothetical protein CWIS_13760 [Cellulomonas sp. A375-1]|uniref:hypothetical protein n=1 Tax=Cellulomonas sp. A375-1 TaxID=1672219 RepID=UPI0006526A36|nr:hypothetical protein [Cellulomonas sp. A375-1]KMM44883.1 hypothetical protein CWIS_13760 [Cellulomonas sp. A375-1]
MPTSNGTRRITAIPAGRDRDGKPLRPREFTIDRGPEDWGDGRSRIFAENASHQHPNGANVFTPIVVLTASIEAKQDRKECVQRAGEAIAAARARQAARSVQDAARAAHRPGGPSIAELEQRIAARRAAQSAEVA